MGIFSRAKQAVKSKANAAIDKAIDPEKELSIIIMQLEEQRKAAYKELLSYKTNAKLMKTELAALSERCDKWEKRAMASVAEGDDAQAKKCLAEKRMASLELAKLQKDYDETAGYAIELNRSRKKLEAKLQTLKLKKGTMATQLAAARGKGALGVGSDETLDKFERASEKMDDKIFESEAESQMAELEDSSSADRLDAEFNKLEGLREFSSDDEGAGLGSDDPLMQLKAKMKREEAGLLPAPELSTGKKS